jgi:hypothetical protein
LMYIQNEQQATTFGYQLEHEDLGEQFRTGIVGETRCNPFVVGGVNM